ncbi:MAG TPA: hypothetical protein VGQ11_10860 [Candidatus Acidoferrales bacterium]|jgi:hypothetical protein|nr:hypothetical protein [Candidatus Acidoferrales bacterium]
MNYLRSRSLILGGLLCLLLPAATLAQGEPNLSKEEIKQFLLTADVVRSRHPSKGITETWRLTLSDGKLTHDASFQSLDAHGFSPQVPALKAPMNFVDSYKYNIAAYELAELLGVGDMIPVTVERKWQGKFGSLSWWVPAKMDEADRVKQKIEPPDAEAWGHQLSRILVFNQLVFDDDFNRTNLLIGEDWKLWRIDFSRAFRPPRELQNPAQLTRCDRRLLEHLKKLDAKEFEQRTKTYLDKWERQNVMARRDKLVAHFQKLIAAEGESKILY